MVNNVINTVNKCTGLCWEKKSRDGINGVKKETNTLGKKQDKGKRPKEKKNQTSEVR